MFGMKDSGSFCCCLILDTSLHRCKIIIRAKNYVNFSVSDGDLLCNGDYEHVWFIMFYNRVSELD